MANLKSSGISVGLLLLENRFDHFSDELSECRDERRFIFLEPFGNDSIFGDQVENFVCQAMVLFEFVLDSLSFSIPLSLFVENIDESC